MAKDPLFGLLFYDPIEQPSEVADKAYAVVTHLCLNKNVVPPHIHPEFEVIFADSLEGSIVVERNVFPLDDKSVFCFRGRQPHAMSFDPRGKGKLTVFLLNMRTIEDFFSHLPGYTREQMAGEIARLGPVVSGERASRMKEVVQELRFFRSQQERPERWTYKAAQEMRLLSSFLSLLFTADTAETAGTAAPESKIQRIMDLLNTYVERRGSLEQIARDCSLSKHHLCRLFKEHTGFTVLGYLHKLRIMRAKYLLAEQGKNVTETALACGFANVTNFIQVFAKFEGKTPKQWLLARKAGKGT